MSHGFMTSEELERELGIDVGDVVQWEADASRGILPGDPSGPVTYAPDQPDRGEAPEAPAPPRG